MTNHWASKAGSMGGRLMSVMLICISAATGAAAQRPTLPELRDVAVELVSGATADATVEVVALGPAIGPWPSRGGAYRVEVFEGETARTIGSTPRQPVSIVRLTVGSNDLLWRLSTEVADVGRRMEEFSRAFESHPEWTEQDAIQALQRAGAKYLPPDGMRVKDRVSLGSLRRWLTVVAVDTPKFELAWQAEDAAVHGRARTLILAGWKVLIHARLSNGERKDYGAVIEPFNGTITYLGTDAP